MERCSAANGATQAITAPLFYFSSATATISLCNLSTANTFPVIQVDGSAGAINPITLSFSQLTCSSATSSALGVVYLTSPIITAGYIHSIVECGINSSALSTGANGTPAIAVSQVGATIIAKDNTFLTRLNTGTINNTQNAIDTTGAGSIANNIFVANNTTLSNAVGGATSNFAHAVVATRFTMTTV